MQDYCPLPADVEQAGGIDQWWERVRQDFMPMQHWWNCLQEASSRVGKPIGYPTNMEQMLEDAGMDNALHRTVRIYLDPVHFKLVLAEEDRVRPEVLITNMCKAAMFTRDEGTRTYARELEGLSMYLLTQCAQPPWNPADVQRICSDIARACNRPRRPVFFNM